MTDPRERLEPDGYEVQWRPRGSDTWDGGSAGVYRTPEIAAEVVQDFTNHETRVRPIAYLDGAPSQSREEGYWRALKAIADPTVGKVPSNPSKSDLRACIGRLRTTARIALGEREP